MMKRLSRPARWELSPQEKSELNRQAHEEQIDYRADPAFREITPEEAAEHRERKRMFREDLQAATSLTEKSKIVLAYQDDTEAIKARYIGLSEDPPIGLIDDDALDSGTAGVNEVLRKGVVWDPYSRDLPRETQLEQGYGPPPVREAEE